MTATDRTQQVVLAIQADAAFMTALGELTLGWSDLERTLFTLLRHYAGVSEPVGRAIFSGTRAKQMIGFLKAIAENTDLEAARASDLQEIFSQINAINSLRDFIVHNVDGSELQFEPENPAERLVTNAARASRTKNVQKLYVSHDHLRAMYADCVECCWRMHAHWEQHGKSFSPGPGTGGVRNPWRFRPPQPKRQREPNGDA